MGKKTTKKKKNEHFDGMPKDKGVHYRYEMRKGRLQALYAHFRYGNWASRFWLTVMALYGLYVYFNIVAGI